MNQDLISSYIQVNAHSYAVEILRFILIINI